MNAIFDQIINEANNYNVYFRAHNEAGISLDAMKTWRSYHDEEDALPGVACSDTLGETSFGGAYDVAAEIVVLRGRRVENIYDGVVVEPTEIVYRFTVAEYELFCDYVNL